MDEGEPPLLYLSQNDHCKETILFIHGAGGYYREWETVVAHISSYHILAPSMILYEDSPTSTSFRQMNLEKSSALLAQLIHDHAKDGKAHVAGFSLGACMAIHFAGHFPQLVKTLFVSGFPRYDIPPSATPMVSFFTWGMHCLETAMPESITSKLNSNIKFDTRGPNINTLAYNRDVLGMLSSKNEIHPVPARTLVVVAGKRGVLPTDDSVPNNKQLLKEISTSPGSQESRAVIAPNMRHAWHLQDKKLFAESVVAWIEHKTLPDELQHL